MPTVLIDKNENPSSGMWLISAFAAIALIIALNLMFQWRMDVFGVLRDPHGRSLVTSHHEPKAKFLLNKAYVPENFDALVIGASASVNWDMNKFTGYRFYNESVEGGNSSGERLLVEQGLPHSHYKVAIVCLYPRITASHELLDGLEKTRPEEAYGSLNAFTIEGTVLDSRWRHTPLEASPNGSHRLPEHALEPIAPDMPRLSIKQDPVGVADYATLIKELIADGTHVLYVLYPLYQPYLDQNAQQIDVYVDMIKRDYPAAPFLNLNAPEYASLRSDSENWIDEVHESQAGAEAFSSVINSWMHTSLRDR